MINRKIFSFLLLFFFVLSLFSAKAFLSWKQKINMEASKAKAPEIKITIIEGWTIKNITEILEKKDYIKSQDFKNALIIFDRSKYPILKSLPKNSNLEGYLFPDTYVVFKPNKTDPKIFANELLKKTLTNFSQKFTPEMEDRARALNMSVHEIITLASIIEKETGRNALALEEKNALEKERKIISGIFYNRLNEGMALESDATINYITGNNNPTPALNDLAIISPYNTYKNKGLPIGPICNPSLSSILAALYPEKTDYFYFLHIQPSGQPIYSKTFEEHVKNKFKYLK